MAGERLRGWALALAGLAGALSFEAAAQTVQPVRPGVAPLPVPAAPPPAAAPSPPEVAIPADIERYRVPIDGQPTRGAAAAPVTIVEFGEFQCPFCMRVQPTLERIRQHYGPQQVRFVWRNNPLPFHQNAEPAALLAMEVHARDGDAAFWAIHDVLFENQRALERSDLEAYGQRFGLSRADVEQALDGRSRLPLIRADQQVASRIGARGTPNFFINGRQLTGAQPFARFQEIIDQELVLAARLHANGVAPGAIYATHMAGAQERAAPSPTPRPRPRPDPAAVYRVPLEGDLPQRGPDDALVTVVIVSDFECPFCARVRPTVESVLRRYGNDVRLVWMNNPLPFHQRAGPSANAALEVFRQGGDAAFWRYHDTLFDHQRELTSANLVQWAATQGLDAGAVEDAIARDAHGATIERQQQLARQLGASGTPSFFINGRSMRGAQPFDRFAALIDEELAKARRLVAEGVPRAQLYARIIRGGATTAQTLQGPAPARADARDPDRVYEIPVPRRAPRRGSRRAPVVVQIFSDFQCPFCRRVLPTVAQLLSEYEGRIQLIWRDYPLPFHQQAKPAAEAAREVFRQRGNDAFWAYHDLLFANQRTLETDDLVRLAGQLRGVNARAVRRALTRGTHRAAVEADMAVVREAGARIGTPAFFINGRLVLGAQEVETFRTAIARALAEAQRAPP